MKKTKKRVTRKSDAKIVKIDFKKSYKKALSVIARRNQNNQVMLLKADEMGLFYKVEGIAAELWLLLEMPRNVNDLIDHFSILYPAEKASLVDEISNFLIELLQEELLITSKEKAEPLLSNSADSQKGRHKFGGIKKFDLEQIESEVLNERIYLDVFAGSDLHLKTNLEPIQDALLKVTQLDGIKFRWKPKLAIKDGKANLRATQAGLIAQQVAENMPELVRSDEKTGILAIEYSKLTAYLVEAIKDLSFTIKSQEKRIRKLERKKP